MARPLSPETRVKTSRWAHIGQPILRLIVCVAAVLAVIAALSVMHVQPDRTLSAALNLFLIVVLITSIRWGTAYAILASLLSTIGFSWWLPPIGHFQVKDARVWTLLTACLVTGLIASRLSGRVRRAVLDANQRRAEAVAEEQRFRDLVNSVEGIVWEADAETFAFSFVSDQAERILGYPKESWLSEPAFWKDHLHPEDRDWAVQFCLDATAQKRDHDFEYRMIAADGRVVWVRDLVTVVVENGRASRLRGVMVDITSRKQAEQIRQELEEQSTAAFESNPTMYFIVDGAGKIVSVNAFGAEQLGYAVGELVGQPVLSVFYEADRDAVQKHANECFEQPGRMMRWEARKICKDGTMLWVRETANAVFLKKRPVMLVACENITEQKRAEEAARSSEKELRDVVNTVPANVWSTSPDGAVDFVNQRWQEFTGLAPEEALGWNWETAVHPDDRDRFVAEWRAALKNGQVMESEVRVRRTDGEYRWLFVRNVPLRDELGNIVKWYGTGIDVEERKRAEQALHAAMSERIRLTAFRAEVGTVLAHEENLRGTLHKCAEAMVRHLDAAFARVWTLSSNSRELQLQASAGMYTRLDGSHSRIPFGQLKIGLIAQERKPHLTNNVQNDPRVSDKEWARREKMISFAGYPLLLEDRVVGVMGMFSQKPLTEGTLEALSFVADAMAQVIDRKRAEELLRESEGRFRTSVDHLTDALFIHDDQDDKGRVIDVNQQACDSLGYTREELIGMTAFDYDPSLDVTFNLSIKERLARGEIFSFESVHRRKDGTEFPVEVRVRPFWHGDRRFGLALARDITDRKRAEAERDKLRQLEADLARINRVTTMGELTASLAHEINQPIAAAVTDANTSVRWLASETPNIEEAREAAKRAVKDATRAGEIISRVRSLFKKGSPQRELVNLNEVIEEMTSLLRNEAIRYGVSIESKLAADLPQVMADRVQLQQVLMNLMLNGIDAMKGVANPRKLTLSSQRDGSNQLLVSVSDTGIGVPSESGQIFQAFFTTKPHGTGMGLAISRTIIESHGGRLWTTSNSGYGAIFYFTLPTTVEAQ